ncbi:MAG: UMP kinase [Chlamydiae bacterium]|nr:UMP kinase [Chlamydiota bacterium]
MKPLYKRVLIKLSGEALMGEQNFGIEHKACNAIANAIKEVYDLGVEIGIVVGGGNIFRGTQAKDFGFARTPADHIGMLATTINGLILQQSLSVLDIPSVVMSALSDSLVEKYSWAQSIDEIKKNKIVIFVGGTGNPYFSTDTAAALRATEIQAEIVLKATKVDGVYTDDPKKNPNAQKFERLTYLDALAKQLNVMDATAIALCRENKIPIYVFNLFQKGSLLAAICQGQGGTLVTGDIK